MRVVSAAGWSAVARGAMVALVAATFATAPGAQAQAFPAKPIRLLVPFPAGGISDVLARGLGARLSASMGQSVVVDNRPGAGTTIAAEMLAKSAPDGYTLMMQDINTHAINASLYARLPYDPVRDFTQVALIAASPLMLVVPPGFQAKTLRELIAMGRAKPGDVSYASPGNGTLPHLVTEAFKKQQGVDFLHIPYKGNAALKVLAGEVGFTFSVMPPAVSNVKAGKLVALAVTSPRRVAAAPEVPTMAEAGVGGFEYTLFSGVLGPAGMPAAVLEMLNAESARAVATPEMMQIFATIGAEGVAQTPAQFTAYLNAEIDRFRVVVRETGAKLD